jgi:hypothetical protein
MKTGHNARESNRNMRTKLIAQAVAAAFALAAPAAAYAADGDSGVDRANVSRTPALLSNKAKIAQLTQYSQARSSDGTAIVPVAGKCTVTTSSGAVVQVGVVRGGKCQVQPQVVTYVDAIEGGMGAQDTFAAVSLDDGQTWRRTNLSHSADKLVQINGVSYGYGDTAKPALSTAGRNMFVAWTGKYCPSGNPSGFVNGDQGSGYTDDLYQVAGPQGMVSYAETYDRPDLGVAAFSCVSAARGTVDAYGNIIWSKADQLTSGRRDAYQLTTAVAGEVGFAAMWQEDPFGLNPGSAAGPGDGMSGAVVNRKTDIWYNHVLWSDFLAGLPTYGAFVPIEPSTPPEDPPTGGRPETLVKMSSPVRVSDNAACKVDVDAGGAITTHYGAEYCKLPVNCASVSPVDENGNRFCVTYKGVVLDGNTGASRPNLFLQKVTYTSGSTGVTNTTAEAIVGYEETKGMGSGSDKEILDDDIGKNVIYHHFPDFSMPDLVQPGTILNTQEVDENNKLLYAADGQKVYGNARRIRFILQPKGNKGASGTVMLAVYKEGVDGKGRQSDIMMRRWVNGYAVGNLVCDNPQKVFNTDGKKVEVCAGINLSTAQPQVIQTDSSGGTPKVITWKWDAKNLLDGSEANPYEDARAHRGFMKGDFVAFGYTWTPNWAAARNGNDVYDYHIRRSFNGGVSWTNLQGQFEDPVNVSNLRMTQSNSVSAIEPRLVGTPSTILAGGLPTGVPDDVQNPMVYFTSFGTASNPDLNYQAEDDDAEVPAAAPLDLYWSWTDNYGESYKLVERIAQGTGELVKEFDWLAKNNYVHEGEAQLRMSPAGTSLSAAWLGETMEGATDGSCIPGQPGGSDICYRRITGLEPLARYDVNKNGVLDLNDWAMLNGAFDTTTFLELYDFNEDGVIDKLEDGRLWLDACKVFVAQYPASGLVCPTVKR